MTVENALRLAERHDPRPVQIEPAELRRLLLRTVSLIAAAAGPRGDVERVFAERVVGHADEPVVRALLDIAMRGAQAPAQTLVPEWGGSLVRETITAFLDLLGEQGSAVASLPLVRLSFDGDVLRVPLRADASSKSLAAAFRQEGGAIRIGSLSLVGQRLRPHAMGALATSTSELIAAAGDGVMVQVIRAGILTDTAKALDAAVFGAAAATPAQPAGLQGYGTSTPATGDLPADMKASLQRLVAAGYGGPNTRWVMHTLTHASLLETSSEAQMRDSVLNIPIVGSTGIASDVVLLVDCAGVVLASDPVRFDAGSEAQVVEVDDAPPSLDAGAPARSLFQTNCTSIRAILPTDWVAGMGAVQSLTGVGVAP